MICYINIVALHLSSKYHHFFFLGGGGTGWKYNNTRETGKNKPFGEQPKGSFEWLLYSPLHSVCKQSYLITKT